MLAWETKIQKKKDLSNKIAETKEKIKKKLAEKTPEQALLSLLQEEEEEILHEAEMEEDGSFWTKKNHARGTDALD